MPATHPPPGRDLDVYEFYVEVLGVAPRVWRRVQVAGGRLTHLAAYLHVALVLHFCRRIYQDQS